MIDKIGAGHYQTRDGYPVVILCLDAPGSHPVVGYYILKNQIVPESWKENGRYSEEEEVSTLDLIPVPRKPREVWLYAGSIFDEEMDNKKDFMVCVKSQAAPNYVLFREVMED